MFAIATPATTSADWFSGLEVRRQRLDSPRDVVLVTDRIPASVEREEVVDALVAAVATWNEVPCSTATLTYAGTVQSASEIPANATAVLFAAPDKNRCFPDRADLGFTLATDCCDGTRTEDVCDGTTFAATTIFLNEAEYEWAADPAPYQRVEPGEPLTVDVQSVLTHELGHALGLRHEEVDPLATMRARYLLDGGLSSLAAADKAALCALYPGGTDECQTAQDCGPFGRCVEDEGFAVCDEFRGAVGDHCALDELICPGICLVSSPQTFSGYCSVECTDDAECAEGFACDAYGDIEACRPVAVDRQSGCSTALSRTPIELFGWVFFAVAAVRARRRWSRASSRGR